MISYSPLLCLDFYKTAHAEQYPATLTKMVSYYTPRMTRLADTEKVTMFGLQAFIQEYLIEAFNTHFFDRSLDEVLTEYKRVLNNTIGTDGVGVERLTALHKLGYLPLELRAVPEGTRTNIHVPQIEISNTNPNFVWLVNSIETMLSCTMWHTQISAEVGYRYRQIVNKYAALTCDDDAVAYGALSTEHSVMCSNYAVDGDEITHVRRLLKEIYPYQNFSMVSDSYDYWNLVNNILPAIKEDVMEHHGCLAIRGDSGNPVEIVTETVFKLWEIFGGTVNSKGYKVLDPHVKALYGDSITPQRCEAVYKILMEHGFAINNVSLGVGSFSMQCLETMDGGEKTYAPYTRDTFGIAVKATYAEDADGKPIMIFKNPKTDSGHFKKSQRGCCKVVYDYTYHNFFCQDGLTWEESQVGNWLQPVFKDGKLLRIYTLDEVRKNLHEGNF